MAEQDKLKVANEALRRIGSSPVAALDEGSKKADTVAAIYDTVVLDAFGATRWLWARRTAKLDLVGTSPLSGWAYAFSLPGDAIGAPVRVMASPRNPDYPLRQFSIEGDELHCSVADVWATCVRFVEPNYWPPAFRRAVVTALAAEFCVPMTQDVNLAADLRAQAWGSPAEGGRGGLMGRAMAQDLAGTPGPAPLGASDPLTDAWHGAL